MQFYAIKHNNMKIIKLLLLCCAISLTAFSQHQPNNTAKKEPPKLDSVYYPLGGAVLTAYPRAKAISLIGDGYDYEFPYHNIGVRFVMSSDSASYTYKGLQWGNNNMFRSIIIDGNCSVEICSLFVDEKNANDFMYHVVQNDEKELVPWTKPSVFKYTNNGKIKYAYLGKFNYKPWQVLKVEIYNIKEYRLKDAVLIDWRKIENPNFIGSIQYVSKKFPNRTGWGYIGRGLIDSANARELRNGRQQSINGKVVAGSEPHPDNIVIWPSKEKKGAPADIQFRLGDSLQNITFSNFGSYVVLEKTYNYKVTLQREIEGHTDTVDMGVATMQFDLYKEFWKYPGKYKITFAPNIWTTGAHLKIPANKIESVSFTVLPALDTEHSIPIKTVEYIILIILTTGAYMFVVYRKSQKRKLAKEAQNRQIATLQLQSVRSQLNPHFIFNALAGIQNLMNKNAIEDANRYLTRFARLTRNVLDDGQKELTTIEHEAALLNDYLQMEQLRFSFKFNINTNDVDPQIEIPAMLLQPFVENAVKHGVSALKEQGMITIALTKNENNLTLSVTDNGKGFSDNKTAGMGIKLCEERIRLLNSIYKNINILLHKKSDSMGTLITIELNNWLK